MTQVAILIFDDVEVLDFCGPYEVFSVTRRADGEQPFDVFTVAERSGPVLARNGLSVNPDYTFDDCPPPDILVVPGGRGTRTLLGNTVVTDWIAQVSGDVDLTLSVCTGSLVLAQAGLLEGLAATTHHSAFDELRAIDPQVDVREGARFVDNGAIITSAGISAGLDMSLYVVARLLGHQTAVETAAYMEYDWRDSENGPAPSPPL
ncbi:MAG: DJ-1/PfpI family protein [Chloroflexi bacterium]|nr:DJ-1/PfpI family protein [Chloroflexota bacterium]